MVGTRNENEPSASERLTTAFTNFGIVYPGGVPLRLQLLIRRAADHVSGASRLIMHRRSGPRRFRVNGRLPPCVRNDYVCHLLFIGYAAGFAQVRRRPSRWRYRTNYSRTPVVVHPHSVPLRSCPPPTLPQKKKTNTTCRFSECFFPSSPRPHKSPYRGQT